MSECDELVSVFEEFRLTRIEFIFGLGELVPIVFVELWVFPDSFFEIVC